MMESANEPDLLNTLLIRGDVDVDIQSNRSFFVHIILLYLLVGLYISLYIYISILKNWKLIIVEVK